MKKEEEFKQAVESVMKYLAENHHPHTMITVNSTSAQIYEGIMVHNTEEFIID